MRSSLPPLLLVGAFAAALSCASTARANDVELSVTPSVPVGKKPALTIKVNKDLETATVDVQGPSGRHRQTVGPKDAGGALVIELPQKQPGKAAWTGTLSVKFADGGTGSMPLSFHTVVLAGFRFQVKDGDVDLAARTLSLTSEHDTAKVDIEVYTDDDELLASTSKAFDGAKAGTPLKVVWDPKRAADVLRIHLTVTDTAGAFQTMDLYPYRLDVPHEDVEFETGKSDIRPSEEAKLVAARREIDKGVLRFGNAIRADSGVVVRLFVRGHTDTVGASSSNRALSERRAQAIARWFAKHGVKAEIFAAGVGEDMPKVETPDETDEPRNRRVEYTVATEHAATANPGWTRVR